MAPSHKELAKIAAILFDILHSNCKRRKCILEGASQELIDCLSKCARIYLRQQFVVSKNQKSKLRKSKSELESLASKAIPSETKKEYLIQSGGSFIGPLISLALPFLLNLISK